MNAPLPFGKYLLVDRINVGGMAEVFMAKAFGVEGFERVLAIKRILPNMADDDEFINMFVDEARIAVQLSHASIVQIYELGKFENQYYIAMEYVSGKDLRQVLDGYRKRQQVMPVPAAAYIASKICEGLDYAHRKSDPTGRPLNVIHRDVSPQNVLVSFEGAVKITDFGIAKAEDRASKTQAGVLKGKFGYMSPEQVRGLAIDHRSDVFAVGILLYEMITGRRLFVGESDFSTLEKVRNAEIVPPRQIIPDLPEALEQVMTKALARERDERYAWASDLHEDLQQFLIEENTVYNAKRVAALLESGFAGDIERERQRMQHFMRVQAPLGYEPAAATPAPSIPGVHGAADVRGEKTMIFETAAPPGDASTAPTAVSLDGSKPRAPRAAAGAARLAGARVTPAMPWSSVATARPPARRLGRLIVGASLLVSVGALLAVLLSPGGGTITITSTPPAVEVALDGQIIGVTPLTRTDVELGVHTLRARARGYAERHYRFELVTPTAVEIPIQLEVLAARGAGGGGGGPAGSGADPSAASARAGGGVAAMGPSAGTPAGASGTTAAPGAAAVAVPSSAAATKSKLVVRSTPDGATLFSGPNRLGVTPYEIPDLDAFEKYSLKLVKDGYRAYETTVAMDGRAEVVVVAELERELRAPPPRKQASVRAGSGCSGSGAKLSVMAKGVADCRVTVGKTALGVSPFVSRDAPAGRCEIVVSCPDGKRYRETRVLEAGAGEKLIIEPDMWN